MRWPLRNQIMLPMAGVMLAALVAVSALNAWLSARRISQQIRAQLGEVARTLDSSSFPLTDTVLRQMRGLSGAQYVLANRQGKVLASSFGPTWDRDLPLSNVAAGDAPQTLGRPIRLADTRYLQTTVLLRGSARTEEAETLHIFYPQESYSDAVWQAASPPLVVGIVAMGLVGALAAVAASRVSRPLDGLRKHVERIARGEFLPIPLPKRDDEIRDLAVSVNRMTEMLTGYEREVRHSERLRTLAQVGGGIAHQMRNAVTGCRMAIDLHARQCLSPADPECLRVARRQLALMETHLQRFLAWGSPQRRAFQQVDLAALIDNLLPLVRPAADHMGVQLVWQTPDCRPLLAADAQGMEQMLLNIVLNAVEAAASRHETFAGQPGAEQPDEKKPDAEKPDAKRPGTEKPDAKKPGTEKPDAEKPDAEKPGTEKPDAERPLRATELPDGAGWVRLAIEQRPGRLLIRVSDSGAGPDAGIQDRLFEPFATNKPDGTGLGLSVAREIAEQHGGDIHWQRSEGCTTFVIEIPEQQVEGERVETTGGG